MKISPKVMEALKVFIIAIVTAALVFLQSVFAGCVSADNGASVKIDKDTNVNVPIELVVPDLEVSDER